MAETSARALAFVPGRRLSLTPRILIINLLPLLLLGGGVFYLDSYRKQLLDERYKLARVEAQITAEALAGASRERQEALLAERMPGWSKVTVYQDILPAKKRQAHSAAALPERRREGALARGRRAGARRGRHRGPARRPAPPARGACRVELPVVG